MNKNLTPKLLKTIKSILQGHGISSSCSLSNKGNITVGMLNSADLSRISPTTLKNILEEIAEKCSEIVEGMSSGNYEIIKRNVTAGEIINNSKREVEILKGYVLECYMFKFKKLILLRIEVDKTLWKPIKTWISVDIDEITGSPWFG